VVNRSSVTDKPGSPIIVAAARIVVDRRKAATTRTTTTAKRLDLTAALNIFHKTETDRMRKRIYISGPISNGGKATPEQRLKNARLAMDVCAILIEKGFAPVCPQLTEFMEIEGHNFEHAVWLDVDFAWVAVSDALYRMEGESVGSDEECAFADECKIPVFTEMQSLIRWRDRQASTVIPEAIGSNGRKSPFVGILDEMLQLHNAKGDDYGSERDCFANVRAAEEFGVDPWLGAVLRASDKMTRLKTFAKRRSLSNESVEDSLLDLANYAVIALALWREQDRKETQDATPVVFGTLAPIDGSEVIKSGRAFSDR
jgi:hypothetical protein